MPATGADIPPELFTRILAYVGTDEKGKGQPWDRAKGDGLQDLKSCSLVCVYWATQCRYILLFWRCIYVHSLEEMKSLDLSAKHGSKRFAMLGELIYGWRLEQTWTSQSWCHTRYNSSFRLKKHDVYHSRDGRHLTLQGPVPPSLPVSALHSPYWSLPRSMPACSAVFDSLELKDIHFPSLFSLSKLLRQFKFLRWLSLEKITWDHDWLLAPVLRPGSNSLTVSARACTDNVHGSRVAYDTLCSGSPFRRLHSQEQDACLELIRTVLRPTTVDHTEGAGPIFSTHDDVDANVSFVSHYCSFQSESCAYSFLNSNTKSIRHVRKRIPNSQFFRLFQRET